MSEFRFLRKDDGGFVLDDVPSWLLGVLGELPDLAGPEQPEAARKRLFQSPIEDDPEAAADWARMVHPELFALLASAREIVLRDLAAAKPPRGKRSGWRLRIPGDHVNAWISALNTARLRLGAVHDVTAEDLEGPLPDATDERALDLHKLDLFGLVQQLLVSALLPPEADPESGSAPNL